MDPKTILVILAGTLLFYVAALSVTHYSIAFYSTLTLFFVALSLMPLFVEIGKSDEVESEKKP